MALRNSGRGTGSGARKKTLKKSPKKVLAAAGGKSAEEQSKATEAKAGRPARLEKPDASERAVKLAKPAKKSAVSIPLLTELALTDMPLSDSPMLMSAEEIKNQEHEWVELFPQGISVATNVGRPILILKDRSGVDILPVWMHPLDAGVALAELSQGTGITPHSVVRRVFQALEMSVESCTFVELIGHHQFVEVMFRGNPKVQTLRLRADEAMSFCLQARARFYSTKAFMAQCRDMDVDLARMEESLSHGGVPALQSETEISTKKHPYVM